MSKVILILYSCFDGPNKPSLKKCTSANVFHRGDVLSRDCVNAEENSVSGQPKPEFLGRIFPKDNWMSLPEKEKRWVFPPAAWC